MNSEELKVQIMVGIDNLVIFDETTNEGIAIVFLIKGMVYIPYTAWHEVIQVYVSRMMNADKM